MTNSFYYFFSATPQVLGGILALFGVFVVFKIQSTKTVLFGIAQNILSVSDEKILSRSGGLASGTTVDIISYIQKGNIKELYNIISKIKSEGFPILRDRYVSIYNSLQSLIDRTIYLSIVTTVTVILCLSLLPFGTFLLNHLYLLYALFGLTIILIMVCCYGLIYILNKALKE
jgi:hypothetical protein